MAETIKAETRKMKRDSAGEVAGTEDMPAPKVLQNLASDSDAQRWMSQIIVIEREKEASEAEQRSAKAAMKSKYDKVYTDAADALKSRGISKRTLREVYEISRRKEEDNRAEFQSKLWLLRASGIEVGQQLAFFDEPFKNNDEALRRAYTFGRNAYADGKDSKANPYNPSSEPGQKWLSGLMDAQAENVPGVKAN
jgi:ribosome modulation factor